MHATNTCMCSNSITCDCLLLVCASFGARGNGIDSASCENTHTEGERDYMAGMIKIIATQVTAILLLVPCTLKGRGISILLLQVLFYIFLHHEYHYTNLHKPAYTLALKACKYHTHADAHTAPTHTAPTHIQMHTQRPPTHPPPHNYNSQFNGQCTTVQRARTLLKFILCRS